MLKGTFTCSVRYCRRGKMNIQEVILELTNKGIFDNEEKLYEQQLGGTTSNIVVVRDGNNKKYVIKSNERKVIKEEVRFLNAYHQVDGLPSVLYVEPSYKYFVYPYLNGSTSYARKNKEKLLISLVEGLLNKYKPCSDNNGWGWTNYLSSSWQEFLLNEIDSVERIIDSRLLKQEDIELIRKIVESPRINESVRVPYLLHGDCGVHNFLFTDNQLVGVIDPIPLIGDPLHDLISAFCSSPEDLTIETIESAVSHLDTWNENHHSLHKYVLIGLFIRLARCTLHHPEDMKDYLVAWDYWKKIVGNQLY